VDSGGMETGEGEKGWGGSGREVKGKEGRRNLAPKVISKSRCLC